MATDMWPSKKVRSFGESQQDDVAKVKPPTLVISEGQLIPPKILDEMPC
jgi:hypothetical protein